MAQRGSFARFRYEPRRTFNASCGVFERSSRACSSSVRFTACSSSRTRNKSLFGFKIGVERPARVSGRDRDVFDACSFKAVAREYAQSRVEQFPPRLFGSLLMLIGGTHSARLLIIYIDVCNMVR